MKLMNMSDGQLSVSSKSTLKLFFTAILVLLGIVLASAQPTGPNPSPTPFGFLEVLALLGSGYGAGKLWKGRKT